MKNYERVLKQQKATYLKSKFVVKQAELFLTDKEFVIESSRTAIRGLGLLNSVFKFNFDRRNNEVIIPFNTIESVSALTNANSEDIIKVTDKSGKDYRFEMKHRDEWLDLIKEKLEILNN